LYFEAGTTLAFQIGSFYNPISFAPTSSFKVTTFGKSQTDEFLISQQSSNFLIQTHNQSSITVANITQTGNTELRNTTELTFQLQTEFNVSVESILTVKLPANIAIAGDLAILFNGEPVAEF
jgi:hypothetical protein